MMQQRQLSVVVYTTPGCGQCITTKRHLDSQGIPYEPVDVSTNAAALEYVTEDLGYSQAPIVVVDEHQHWTGYRPDLIDALQQQEGPTMITHTPTTAEQKAAS